MPKTLPAALTTHVTGDVTTLAVCWRITRVDGEVFRFTDHDEDISFLSGFGLTVVVASGETYRAIGAFSRTAIAVKTGLRVDNLDLSALISPDETEGGIYLQDLQTRKFTNAEVEIFMVNWNAPDDGAIPIMHGNLGEIKLNVDTKTYEAEMRGLSQKYFQKIGELYTFKCRADLFDERCNNTTVNPGGDLNAEDFTQRTLVESQSGDRRTFTVPSNQHITDAAPSLDSGVRFGAVSGSPLRLKRGPRELGTRDAPFLVSTPAELDDIRDNPKAFYALENDIDMSGFGFWTPIPTFIGGLDGRGFAIIDLDVDRPGNAEADGPAAFIDRLLQGAVIRRLVMLGGIFQSGLSSTAGFFAAPLAARTTPDPQHSGAFGVVEDCAFIGCEVLDDTTAGTNRMSGCIGEMDDFLSVRRCFAACQIAALAATRNHPILLVGNILAATAQGISENAQTMEDNYTDEDRQIIGAKTSSDFGDDNYGTNESETEVTRLTTAQAKSSSNLVGFDFEKIWLKPEDIPAAAYVDTGGETLTFNENGASQDTVVRSAGSWITDGFEIGDRIEVTGSATDLTHPAGDSQQFIGGASLFLDTFNRQTGSWITDGWVVGLLATISGSKVARNDGTHLIHSLTATVLTFTPGVIFTTTTANTNVTTSTLGNDGPKDIVAVTATTLTLARHNGFRQTGALLGSGITVTASKYPRPLIVRAP